jgi:hypothetical protein
MERANEVENDKTFSRMYLMGQGEPADILQEEPDIRRK